MIRPSCFRAAALALATLPPAALAPLMVAGAATAAVPAVTAMAGPARPAQSGARDSAATLGPLAIGADVRDATGADIGHVTRLTTDKQGRQVAEIRDGETVRQLPLGYLYARGGAAFSTVTLDALKHGWKPD